MSAYPGNPINPETSTKRLAENTKRREAAIYFIAQTEITVQSKSPDEYQQGKTTFVTFVFKAKTPLRPHLSVKVKF